MIPRLLLLLVCAAGFVSPTLAAINPEEFMRAATEVVHVRERARVVEVDREQEPRRQRVTLLVEVVSVERSTDPSLTPGATLLIDYSIDLVDLAKKRRAHQARGAMPGPQFMHVPLPPELSGTGEFTAYLASPSASVRRYAGFSAAPSTLRTGSVFVPAAGQYSFRTH